MRKKRISSIKEIAALADCSIATVSNTLNNKGRISRGVRENILKICREHGYLPNSVGRNLRLGRNETVGLLFYPSCSAIFRNVFYADIVEALGKAMEAKGYDLLFSGYDFTEDAEPPRFIRQGKTDGIILLGGFPRRTVLQLYQYGIPLIHLDNFRKDIPIDNVTSDGLQAGELVVDHLVGLGHRRIFFLAHKHEDTNADQRELGFRAAAQKHDLPKSSSRSIRNFADTGGAYRLVKAALKGKRPPTALFCVNDTLAAELIQCLQADGYHVPEDVTVFGFNDDEDSIRSSPTISTVRVEKESLGRIGAETILKRIDNPDSTPQSIRLPVELVHRQSEAKPKGA